MAPPMPGLQIMRFVFLHSLHWMVRNVAFNCAQHGTLMVGAGEFVDSNTGMSFCIKHWGT